MDTTTERPVASVEPTAAVTAPAQHARLVPGLTVQMPPREFFPWQRWTLLAEYDNFWEANIVGGLLENHDIPVQVFFTWPDLSLRSRSILCVPRDMEQRARWLLAWPAPTDAELNFLATGKFD
jgi:hypothetical protein